MDLCLKFGCDAKLILDGSPYLCTEKKDLQKYYVEVISSIFQYETSRFMLFLH